MFWQFGHSFIWLNQGKTSISAAKNYCCRQVEWWLMLNEWPQKELSVPAFVKLRRPSGLRSNCSKFLFSIKCQENFLARWKSKDARCLVIYSVHRMIMEAKPRTYTRITLTLGSILLFLNIFLPNYLLGKLSDYIVEWSDHGTFWPYPLAYRRK